MQILSPRRHASLAYGIEAARRRSGLTVEEASHALTRRGIRCRCDTLLMWERGHGPSSREPRASDLSVIAEVYECDIADLLKGPDWTVPAGSVNGHEGQSQLPDPIWPRGLA